MSAIYKRSIPLGIASVAVLFLFISFIYTNTTISNMETRLFQWGAVIIAISSVVGLANVLKIHVRHLSRKTSGQWYYSVVLIASVVIFLSIVFATGTTSIPTTVLYQGTTRAMSSALHSLNLFYIVWAGYKALRFRTIDGSVLMTCAVLTMIGMIPLGPVIWPGFSFIAEWLATVVNTAGERAILIGVGLGTVLQAVRMIRGLERGFLGPEED